MEDTIKVQGHHFTIVPNEALKDSSLSARAKGLYAYLLSNQEDFIIYKKEVVKHFKEGRDAIYKAFDELIERGWIIAKYKRDKGKFGGSEYIVVRDKLRMSVPQPEKPDTVNPAPEKPDTENPSLINNNSNKQQIESVTTKSKAVAVERPSFIDQELWDEYLATRKRVKASNSPRALNTLVNKLKKIEEDAPGEGLLALENANEAGWKSVYPPDNNQQSPIKQRRPFPRSESREERNRQIFEQVEQEEKERAQRVTQTPLNDPFNAGFGVGVTIDG